MIRIRNMDSFFRFYIYICKVYTILSVNHTTPPLLQIVFQEAMIMHQLEMKSVGPNEARVLYMVSGKLNSHTRLVLFYNFNSILFHFFFRF